MAQTAERFQQVEAIFHEALEAPGEGRAAWVETRCGGDLELAAEVNSLLAALRAEAELTASERPPLHRALLPDASSTRPPCLKGLAGEAARPFSAKSTATA